MMNKRDTEQLNASLQSKLDEDRIRYLDNIDDGICPICGDKMIEKQTYGHVYASPCGHELYREDGHVRVRKQSLR